MNQMKWTLGLVTVLIIVLFTNAKRKPLNTCDSPVVGGHTGAPGETGCNGCHPGTANTGSAAIQFDLGTTTYVPGQTYTGFVRISQAGMQKFGFSALALRKSNNTTTGTFGLINATRTRTYSDGNRKYVSHTPCGADSAEANSWSFTWKAPTTNVDTIVVYLGALAANHNHALSGDFGYERKIVLAPQTVSAVADPVKNQLKVIHNQEANQIMVSGFGNGPIQGGWLRQADGKTVWSLGMGSNGGEKELIIPTSGLKTGLYFLNLKTAASSFIQRVHIQ